MIAFGEQMFDTLFQGDVRRLYDEARTRHGRKLDFIFTSMIPWIAEKPWEFAHDPVRKCFLATEEMRFTRNVLTSIPADQINPGSGPLRILVASAQPVGYARLSIEQEEAVIRRGFEPLIAAGLVTVTTLARATPKKLHGYLSNGEFDVVHFIGHGTYDEERGEGRLVFVNEQGQEHSLGERSVREIFCRRNLSLVFLNACETGAAGRAEFNKGVAQSLVAHGLPAVVANQYSVLDLSATSFAQHIYWSLAQGNSLGELAREARIAVNYSLHGEPIDWAVPVLYARDFKPGTVQAACKAQLRSRNPCASRLTACDCCTQRPRRRLGHGQCLSGIGSHARADECCPEGIWLRARSAVGSTRCLGPAGRQTDVSTGRNALQIDCAGRRSSWKSTFWPVSRVIGCGMMST